jgi:hypothetical protein
MPRNLNLGASTLRNRNRVTNKTRLRVVTGNIDADPLVLDDDEEKARVLSTAGVDAEDANVSSIFLQSSSDASFIEDCDVAHLHWLVVVGIISMER